MTDKPVIAMFWKGSSLSWLERLSLFSFIHDGYQVKLFTTEALDPGVEGVEVLPHQEVCSFSDSLMQHAAPSFLADIFRLYLQKRTDFVWMDTDILSYAPLQIKDGYLIAGSGDSTDVNNASLRLPADSPALNLMLEYIENPKLIPEWMKRPHQRQLQDMPLQDRLLAQGQLMRIVYGPKGLTHIMEKTGEHKFAQPGDVLAPVPWVLTDVFFNPKGGVEGWLTERTQVIHLFADQLRSWHKNRPIPPGCFIDQYMTKIGFPR